MSYAARSSRMIRSGRQVGRCLFGVEGLGRVSMMLSSHSDALDLHHDVIHPETCEVPSLTSSSVETVEPVFCLHGLLGSHSNWRTTSKRLAERTCRPYVLADLRNHGDSPYHPEMRLSAMSKDVAKLGTQFLSSASSSSTNTFSSGDDSQQSFTLLGHSLGGKVAMQTAFDYSDLVSKLVIVDIAPTVHDVSKSASGRVLRAMKEMDLKTIGTMEDADHFLRNGGVNCDLTRAFVLQNLRKIKKRRAIKDKSGKPILPLREPIFQWRVNLDVLIDQMWEMSTFPDPSVEHEYDGPALFIFGGKSDIVLPEHYDSVHRFFPNAEIHIIDKAAHMPHFEAREELEDVVADFLAN